MLAILQHYNHHRNHSLSKGPYIHVYIQLSSNRPHLDAPDCVVTVLTEGGYILVYYYFSGLLVYYYICL